MTVYYARNSSGQNFGCYLDVLNLQVTSDRLNVGVSGGHHSYAGSWYFTTYASLSYYESSGHDWENGNYSVSGSGDQWFFSATDYFWRRETDRSINLYCYTEATVNGQYGTANANVWVTVPHLPNAPTNLQATYVSDNRIDLSWTAPTRGYEAMCLEVSIDGGSWSEFSVLWNSSTSTSYNQSSADHSYSFRARAYYKNAYSSYTAATSEIKTTPAMPKSISTAAVQGTTVTVNVVNGSSVATKLQYGVSTNGGQTWGATQNSASLTSFDVSISGTGRVRVRNYNSTGVSGWLESEDVTTICPPGPPTLTAPSSNVLNLSDGSVTFSWLHNSIDGSAQTAAKLRYSTDDGGTWTTVDMNPKTDNSYTIDPVPWSTGTTVKWQMQTKGADANYSNWSQTGAFIVYTAPTVSITSPGATITGMPISLAATYSDMAGFTCQAATVSLTKDGRTLYSESATINGTSITSSLDVSEFLPTNGESYTVVLDVRSSSSLQSSANATFLVDFTEPAAGELEITNDADTGYVSLLATFDNSASEITYTGSTNEQYESTEGYVRSLTVEGRSEKWNQLGRFAKLADYPVDIWGSAFNSFTIAPDGLSASVANTRLPNTSFTIGAEHQSHKLYFSLDVAVTGTFTNRFVVNFGGTLISTLILDGASNHITAIGTMGASYNSVYIYPNGPAGSQAVTCDYTFANFNLIDLTAIFGAGNEPTTVEAFKATDVYKAKLAAGELYDYDAGSLVSIEGVGVRGRNLLPLKFYKGLGYNAAEGADKTSTLQEVSDVTQSGDTFTRAVTAWGDMSMISQRLEAGTYKLSCHVTSEAMRMTGYTLTDDLHVSRRLGNYSSPNEMDYTPTVTLTADECYIAFSVGSASAGNVSITAPMLVYGSTAHAYEPYSLTTITTTLRSAGSVHDQLQADADSWTVERKVGTRAYQAGDESNPDVLTDGTTTYYALTTPTHDASTSYSTIEIGSAFTVETDLDSTFSMTAWDGSADASSISVSRVNADGTITPLLTDGASGSGFVDRYAPLNTAYQYAVTTKASTQAVNTVYISNKLSTKYFFVYWGNNIASAMWNPENAGISTTTPTKTRVHYPGRRDPVSYSTDAVSETSQPSWMFLDKAEVGQFRKLMWDGGRGIYKSVDGDVFHADFELTENPAYTEYAYYGTASLSVIRIAGEQL